jgi:hypothetical protein
MLNRKETSAVLTQNQEKYQEVLEQAQIRYHQNPDWVTFFREVLGVGGVVRTAFPTFDALTAFEQSPQFDAIQKLLVRLREKRTTVDAETEPTRVITVRLPKSMHEYLRTEAHDLRTSMNKLCISKLLQVIGEDMIPNERAGGAAEEGSAAPAPRLSQGTTPTTPSLPMHPRTQSTPSAVAASSFSASYQAPSPPPFKSVQARV